MDVTSLISTAQAFTLPGLLPTGACVLLYPHPRQAILLLPGGENGMHLSASPLSPSAACVFQVLLQAYPGYGTYPQLSQALNALPSESPCWSQELEVRPIRRALWVLAPTLRVFGLKSLALRGHGYQLVSAEEGPWHLGGAMREKRPQNWGKSRSLPRPTKQEDMLQ